LYTAPLDSGLASFIGEANLIDGVLEPARVADGTADGVVATALGRLPARCAGQRLAPPCQVTVLIRPEQIILAGANGATGPVGQVIRRGYHGHDTLLHIRIASQPDGPLLLVRALGSTQLRPGDSCTIIATGTALVWPNAADVAGRSTPGSAGTR
ncbi:MAG: TOBE domain-containing protein, partial [Solirubrobacteraceae bacterium]